MRTDGMTSLSRGTSGRILVAVVVAYLVNGFLVMAIELALSSLGPEVETPPYHLVDPMFQCLFTVAGYVCCAITRSINRAALIGLMALGVLVGSISLVTSWRAEPHWYGIALLIVYPPSVWIGWAVRAQRMSPPLL